MSAPYNTRATPGSVTPDAPVLRAADLDYTTLTHDTETIERFASWLGHARHGGCAEVRILNSPRLLESGYVGAGTHTGYFIDPSRIALQVSPWDGGHPDCGIYIGLNPLSNDLRARADHRMRQAKRGGGGSADDVVQLVHLPLDFDPVRPAGIPSTADELAAALQARDQARERLAAVGIHGAVATSGNGGYLILPTIGYQNTDENREAWGHLLDGLVSVLSTKRVKLDDALKDPSRIVRLLGTINSKGDGTPGRPWRLSTFTDPGEVEPVDLLGRAGEILRSLGAAPPTIVQVSSRTASATAAVPTGLPKRERKHVDPEDTRPGTDYNTRTTWSELLTVDGWTQTRPGDETAWTRPGKSPSAGQSATTNHDGSDRLFVFTSSTDLEADRYYDRFGYYAAMRHGGDVVAAARALAAQGYGAQKAAPEDDSAPKGPKVTATDVAAEVLQHEQVIRDGSGTLYLVSNGRAKRCGSPGGRYSVLRAIKRLGAQPSRSLIESATLALETEVSGPPATVHVRVARVGQRVILDIGTAFVRVDQNGWTITDEGTPGIYFLAPVLAQVPPVHLAAEETRATLEELRTFLLLKDDASYHRTLAWLLSALGGRGAFAILCLVCAPGSGKTTASTSLRDLVDPQYGGELTALPRDERNLAVMAASTWLVCLDNLSKLPGWAPDAICRLATGGAVVERSLWTNGDPFVMSATRPVLATNTGDVLTRGDLADRVYPLRLGGRLKADERMTVAEYSERWSALRPRVLGVLLSALSHGLAHEQELHGPWPRLADACRLAVAASPALGVDPAVMREALMEVEREGAGIAAEADPLTAALKALMYQFRGSWSGDANTLLTALREVAPDQNTRNELPRRATLLGTRLNELGEGLRQAGIHVERSRDAKRRLLTITADEYGSSSDCESPEITIGQDQVSAA